MEWYNYLSAFFAGLFLANFVPHFVTGICGNGFPTPFSKPSGRGLSSPIVNVSWSFFNLIIGYILFKQAKISFDDNLSVIILFIGFALMSLFSSVHFVKKEKPKD